MYKLTLQHDFLIMRLYSTVGGEYTSLKYMPGWHGSILTDTFFFSFVDWVEGTATLRAKSLHVFRKCVETAAGCDCSTRPHTIDSEKPYFKSD